MFSFTKVENWKNVNFLPKCTRLQQIASRISKFSRSDTLGTPSLGPGEGHPIPRPLPHSALRPLDGPPWEFHTPPWNKRMDKALVPFGLPSLIGDRNVFTCSISQPPAMLPVVLITNKFCPVVVAYVTWEMVAAHVRLSNTMLLMRHKISQY